MGWGTGTGIDNGETWAGKESMYVANECIQVQALSVYNSSLQPANKACEMVRVQDIPDQKQPLIMGYRALIACMQLCT